MCETFDDMVNPFMDEELSNKKFFIAGEKLFQIDALCISCEKELRFLQEDRYYSQYLKIKKVQKYISIIQDLLSQTSTKVLNETVDDMLLWQVNTLLMYTKKISEYCAWMKDSVLLELNGKDSMEDEMLLEEMSLVFDGLCEQVEDIQIP